MIANRFRGRRVAVTGDTGFKGSWLCAWLLDSKAEVFGYGLPPRRPDDLFVLLELGRRIHHTDGDILDYDSLSTFFQQTAPEFVFHLAAQSLVSVSYSDPKGTFDTNVAGSVNVLEIVRQTTSVRSLIYVSSDKCYKNKEWVHGYRETDELGGSDPYSASKVAAEAVFSAYYDSFFIHRQGFGAASVRAGNVIGGGDCSTDRLIPDCIRALSQAKPIIVRNPKSTRPWQHVLDALSGYLLLAIRLEENPQRYSGVWNFRPASDNVRTVRQLVDNVVQLWGAGSIKNADMKSFEGTNFLRISSDKARHELGWTTCWEFDEAIMATVEWYLQVAKGKSATEVTKEQLHSFENASSSHPTLG
jgi:CDP-glucose 4,6-dehydratase